MSEHDVPAERDELRRNFAAWLDEWRFCPACDVQLQRSTGTEFVPTWHRHEDDCVLAGILALLATQEAPSGPAPETREPELLGYVVERQLTTGEWMRVWRGSTMWVDHDEAVLDRNAYALDGIPAHIRPVYLGAPAPAEATEAPCYCTPGVYTPSADCPRHMRPAEKGASHDEE